MHVLLFVNVIYCEDIHGIMSIAAYAAVDLLIFVTVFVVVLEIIMFCLDL
jgi:hypothetical protein